MKSQGALGEDEEIQMRLKYEKIMRLKTIRFKWQI